MSELRVIDFGSVSALRSQSLWHALAKSAGESGAVTLSFMRPSSSYVGLGLLRNIEEIDTDYCSAEQLPIFRRQVGGGPVYLDENQLFFQVCAPLRALPRVRHHAISKILAPFTRAFRAAGINASLDSEGEISVNGSKVCGHGAGEIGDGAVVVGNLIERFDHLRASSILRTGSPLATNAIGNLMGRYVGSREGEIEANAFIPSAIGSLSDALGMKPFEGELSPREWDLVNEFDTLLGDPLWTSCGEFEPQPLNKLRTIKIRAGVYVAFREAASPPFLLSSVFGVVEFLVADGFDAAEQLIGLDIKSVLMKLHSGRYISDDDFYQLNSSELMREVA